MILYNIILVILFILVLVLFYLVLKPELLNKKQSTNDQEIELQPSKQVKPQVNLEDFSSRQQNIVNRLLEIKENFHSIHSNQEIALFSIIDNIIDYINRVTPLNEYLLDTLENKLFNLDISRPGGDPFPKMDALAIELTPIHNFLYQYHNISALYRDDIQVFYKNCLLEISGELKKFKQLKNILANTSTIEIYQVEKKQHLTSYIIYLTLFFIFIIFGLTFAYFSIELKEQIINGDEKNIIDYWVLKASGIFVSITLITFFLKQAVHHQKRKEHVERTMLELKALPAYMAELSSEDAKNLRNTLASKYFGNSNDNSTINEISGLLTEQLKNSTEVAKSSAEVIKSLQPKT